MIKKTLCPLVISSFALLLSNIAVAANYTVAPALSSVSFATIKSQFIVEPAVITDLTGDLINDKFSVLIDFKKVKTGIGIRDSRINELYLKTNLYPQIRITGNFAPSQLKKTITKENIQTTIEIYGRKKKITIPVIIHHSNNVISVNSTKPIIIKGADFGIPSSNLAALAAKIGGTAISDAIPVNFNVVFDLNTPAVIETK